MKRIMKKHGCGLPLPEKMVDAKRATTGLSIVARDLGFVKQFRLSDGRVVRENELDNKKIKKLVT